jgi:hypothetical protein
MHLDHAGTGCRRARIEHLSLEIGLEAADHQAKARQPGAHDLAQVGHAGILQELYECAVVDVAVGVDIGEPEIFGSREAVDAAIGKIERHED